MSAALERPFGVPRENMGQARALRNTLVTADQMATIAVERISAPLQARTAKGSIPRPELLAEAADLWREKLAGPGRLTLDIQQARNRLLIRELRLTTANLRSPDWSMNEVEAGFVILVAELSVQRRTFRFDSIPLSNLSLHSVARWFQRNFDTTPTALAADLATVASAISTLDQTSDSRFSIPVVGGRWVGTVQEVIDVVVHEDFRQKVLSVRTFLTD